MYIHMQMFLNLSQKQRQRNKQLEPTNKPKNIGQFFKKVRYV